MTWRKRARLKTECRSSATSRSLRGRKSDAGGWGGTYHRVLPAGLRLRVLRKRERAREDDDGCDALDIVVGYQTNSGTVGVLARWVVSYVVCLGSRQLLAM